MRKGGGRIFCSLFFFAFCLFLLSSNANAEPGDDYSFDLEEFESKPFEFGGYAEIKWEHMNLDNESAFYYFNFYDDHRCTIDRFTGTIQLNGRYKKGIWSFNGLLNADSRHDNNGWSDSVDIFEASLSLKPTPFATIDLGKKMFKWGKGYAWNPVGFIDRTKDPNDPEEAMEGYIGAGLDLIKSFDGSLQTVALTTVVLPVWEDVNDDFGERNHVNLAGKLYMLYLDTDIDFIIYTGNSRSTRYGVDFSRNLTTNFEIHGEYAYITDFKQNYLSETGELTLREGSVKKYLAGLRYLTESDITTIIEFYHNGAGFSESELGRFYQLIDDAYTDFQNTGSDDLLQAVKNISGMGYAAPQAGRNYLYFKINQKDPFDILYFTPGLITILNLDDQSVSISPEIQYTGFTNWELRMRMTFLNGGNHTEFEEKQNENKLECRIRYHF